MVDFLRKTYGIEKTESDINYGDKFSFALYFDKTMNYIGDSFFFTASAYMRYFKKVPTESEFHKFEQDLKEEQHYHQFIVSNSGGKVSTIAVDNGLIQVDKNQRDVSLSLTP